MSKRFKALKTLKVLKAGLIYTLCASLASLPWYGVSVNAAELSASINEKGDLQSAASAGKSMSIDMSSLKQSMTDISSDSASLTPSATTSSNTMQVDDVNALQDMWQKDELYSVKGEAYLSKLNERSKNATTNAEDVDAAAYATIVDSNNLDKSTISYTDNIFNYAKEILADYNTIKSSFADCETNNEYFTEKTTIHVPDYQQCTVITDKSGQCDITHAYNSVEPLIYVDGEKMNMKNCDDEENCKTVWVGKVGDDYWGGYCKLYASEVRMQVPRPDAIKKVTLDYAKWDDYMRIYVGEDNNLTKIWQGPESDDSVFPWIDTDANGNQVKHGTGKCERSTSWRRYPNQDITNIFTSVEKNSIIRFKIQVSVSGGGEGYARLKIRYDPTKLFEDNGWTPDSCFELARAITDGMASGSVSCVDLPDTDRSGCATYNGYQICPGVLTSSGLKGISNLCRKVRITADYNFYRSGGAECYTAFDGSSQCYTSDNGKLDTCQDLINSGCGFISQKCEDYATGSSGTCYAYERTYDCGTDQLIDSVSTDKTTSCSGSLACTGTDCIDTDYTQSEDFTKVAALLNVAQQAAKDMKCTGTDDDGNIEGDEDVVCGLFEGTAYQCKKAFFGVQDCCDTPVSISVADYILTTISVYQADAALMDVELQYAGMFQSSIGGYQTLHNSVTSFVSKGFSSVTEPIASYVQNIAGAVSKVTDAVKWISTAIEDLKKEILKYISKALVELAEKMGVQFGGGAAGGAAIGTAAAEEAKKQAAEDLAGYLGTAFAVVGYVYMAYQVAMLIIQTVYKCTKEEYELNANRALKQCHYIGSYKKGKVVKTKYFSYCCYESPLARILQEQIQPQLGNKGFGTAKEPVCGSLSVEDFANVDWSKIDLSEWIALMQEAGEFGADTTQYTIEALTGVGSTLDLDSNTREDATERAVDRLEDVDIDTIRETVRSKVSVDTTGKEVENQNQ